MEIHALHVVVTEQDLNELVRKHAPPDLTVEDVRIRLSPEGVHVSGVYPFFINVKFETVWQLTVQSGKAVARLATFKAMGVPGNIFKSAIMKMIEDIARKEPWVSVVGDQVQADPDQACAKFAVAGKTHLRSIIVQSGILVVEAGY
jgi:hypothetical protein